MIIMIKNKSKYEFQCHSSFEEDEDRSHIVKYFIFLCFWAGNIFIKHFYQSFMFFVAFLIQLVH